MAKLEVTQTKSALSALANQKATLHTLGLKKVGQSVVREDRPEVLGMIHTVRHLVTVREVN